MKKRGFILSLVASSMLAIPPGQAYQKLQNSRISQNEDFRLEVYPVKSSHSGKKEELELNGHSYVKLTHKPFVVKPSHYEVDETGRLAIRFFLDKKKSKQFAALTNRYKNHKMAFVHNGKVLMAPTIKKIINNGEFEIHFSDPSLMQNFLSTLESASS